MKITLMHKNTRSALPGSPQAVLPRVDKTMLVAVNGNGIRVGESHPRVQLTDGEVELIRAMHEDLEEPLGYSRLATIFEVSKRTIRDICAYRRRAETVVAWVEPRQAQRERRKAMRVRLQAGVVAILKAS